MSRMVFRGMATVSLLPSRRGADRARRGAPRPWPADLSDHLVHLLRHQRLALAGDLGGVGVEDILADPAKGGLVLTGAHVAVGKDATDGNGCPDRGPVVVDAD